MSVAGIGKFLNNINGLPASQQGTIQAIQQASTKTGVDFAYLVKKANIESNMNTHAKSANSSASGLYQFVQNTWLDIIDRHGAEYGLQGAADAITRDANNKPVVADKDAKAQILALRNNPQVAAAMAAELAAENASALKEKVGGKIGPTEMYLAHFLGANGAGDLLEAKASNPNQPAAKLLPEAAAANHNVFYTDGGRARTVGEIYANFAKKFDDTNVADITNAMPKAAPVASNGAVDAANVQMAAMDCSKTATVLATITPDCAVDADAANIINNNNVVAFNGHYKLPSALRAEPKERVPELTGTTGDAGLDSLLDNGTQYSAMMIAQQIVDSTRHTSSKNKEHQQAANNPTSTGSDADGGMGAGPAASLPNMANFGI